MEKISWQQFMLRQPNYPEETLTDKYFFALANKLVEEASGKSLLSDWPAEALPRIALCVIGYYQDVLADAGIWRTFINANHKLYGKWLPFYNTGDAEEYIPYELNLQDIEFLVWYAAVMNVDSKRFTSPGHSGLRDLAHIWWEFLNKEYDEAPEPENFNIARGLEINNPEEQKEVWHLCQWLFLHCYLMTPAFALTLQQILADPEIAGSDDITKLHDSLDRSMSEDPTGPLALFIREWIYLILENKLPPEEKDASIEGRPENSYYEKFVTYTGGDDIRFFGSYDDVNEFFIKAIGWKAGERHLPHLSSAEDFVLMVTQGKGMLLAKDICKCIAMPGNPYYNKEYARDHAFELLSVRGCCPPDLLHRLLKEGALPDAHFLGSDDREEVSENADFIARLYLQQFYRGD